MRTLPEIRNSVDLQQICISICAGDPHTADLRQIRSVRVCRRSETLRILSAHVVCAFCARRLSVERYSYSDVAGWVAGWWLAGWLAGWVAVTRRYCIKTAKPIGKLFRPSESPIILVF